MSRTKITGVLLLTVAILKIAVDALDGGTFDLHANLDALVVALQGAGLVFLRDGVQKVIEILGVKK